MRKLGRRSEHRLSLLKNLSISLIESKRIKTTLPKAKELRRFIEPLITRSKVNTLESRRYLLSSLMNNEGVVNKLLSQVGPSMKGRPGGYTRIVHCIDKRGLKRAFIEIIEENNIIVSQ